MIGDPKRRDPAVYHSQDGRWWDPWDNTFYPGKTIGFGRRRKGYVWPVKHRGRGRWTNHQELRWAQKPYTNFMTRNIYRTGYRAGDHGRDPF